MTALPFPGARPPEPPPRTRERGPRYLVLHLPAFRLERCGLTVHEAAVLVAEERSAVRVVALTPAAQALGLRKGMTATEARAVEPSLWVEPLDEEGERADRAALVAVTRTLVDQVSAWGLEAVALEVSGAAHLYGGEAGMAGAARALLEGLGHLCRLALSDDPLASEALAVWADNPDLIVPPGGLAQALSPLPVAALRPSPALARALAAVGVQRVGQLARLDPASVAGRYGHEGHRLHRLSRGRPPEARWLSDPEDEPVALTVALGGPTAVLGPVLFALKGMLAQAAQRLAKRDLMAARLAISLVPERGAEAVVRVRIGRPTRSPEVLERVVRARLEGLRLEAPAVEIALRVEEAVRDPGWQPGLTERTEAGEDLQGLLARLADALGEAALHSPTLVDSWCPEQAWAPAPVLAPQASPPGSPARRADPVEAQRAWERDVRRPRPTVVLSTPQPVQVRVEGGHPARVSLERGWVAVTRDAGPERLEGGWWLQEGGFARDYWVVDLQGSVGWLFLEQGRWFLHGWFD